MVDPQIVLECLVRARDDFEFARINFEEKRPYFAQICFHFQQSAEKFLKAFIVAHELDFRKTHDLPLLLTICESHDSSFSQPLLKMTELHVLDVLWQALQRFRALESYPKGV